MDIQARSMRDNLVFSDIPEQVKEESEEDAEALVCDLIQNQRKLPSGTVNSIMFHRVHQVGG